MAGLFDPGYSRMSANTFVLRCEDLSLISIPAVLPGATLQSLVDPFAIPSIPGILPSPSGYGAAIPVAADLTGFATYPGNLNPNTLNRTSNWALPGALLLSISALALTFAAFRISYATASARPTSISCADFMKHPAKAGWYNLTGCQWDVSESVWEQSAKQDTNNMSNGDPSAPAIDEVYVPVYPPQRPSTMLTHVVVLTTDRGVRSTVTTLSNMKSDDVKVIQKWTAEHKDELTIHRDIEGTIVSEADVAQSTRDKIVSPLDGEVSPDFVVIKEGDRPSGDESAVAATGAIFIGYFAVFFWILVVVSVFQRSRPPVRN